MAIKAPKGTKDTMPKDSFKVQYIEREFAELCRRYGFGGLQYVRPTRSADSRRGKSGF